MTVAAARGATVVSWELRGAAKRALTMRDPALLLVGAAGTGKSRGCMIKLHLLALKYPGADLLAVRKVARSLASSFVTEFEDVAKEAIAAGIVKFFGGSPRKPPQYQYENGSTITLGGLDDPIKIMSTQRDVVYVQEATELTLDDWESLDTRMRGTGMPYSQILADCNPDAETHWLKKRADAGRVTVLTSVHEDNPRFFHADGTKTPDGVRYMARLDSLTGVRYLRLRKGLWAAAEGVIYDEWDASIHHVDRFPIPWDWTRYLVIDFGHTHPFVAQWWAEDDDGRLFMYREIFMTKRLVEDHARDMLRAMTKPRNEYVKLDTDPEGLGPLADIDSGKRVWTEPEPFEIICDHDAEGRATLEKYLGRSTTAATKAVTEGIEAVQSRMRRAGDGRPRVVLLKDSLVERDQDLVDRARPACTVEEIPGYVWDKAEGPNKKERPVKDKDDGCDGMRYVVAHRDLGPGMPGIRYTS